jgi:hypothetical protein
MGCGGPLGSRCEWRWEAEASHAVQGGQGVGFGIRILGWVVKRRKRRGGRGRSEARVASGVARVIRCGRCGWRLPSHRRRREDDHPGSEVIYEPRRSCCVARVCEKRKEGPLEVRAKKGPTGGRTTILGRM